MKAMKTMKANNENFINIIKIRKEDLKYFNNIKAIQKKYNFSMSNLVLVCIRFINI